MAQQNAGQQGGRGIAHGLHLGMQGAYFGRIGGYDAAGPPSCFPASMTFDCRIAWDWHGVTAVHKCARFGARQILAFVRSSRAGKPGCFLKL